MSGIETFPVTVVVLDVISGAYSVARQTLRLLSSILFFTQNYGVKGWLLCFFENPSIWRVQVRILRGNSDTDAMNFKRAVQDECSIIAVASTILAQIAITALSLDNLSQTHWVARGCFTFSLVSSIIAVYYATKQYCHLGRCLTAEDIRTWIRGKNLKIETENPTLSTVGSTWADADAAWRKFGSDFPSIASVLTVSAPNMLLDSSLNSFLVGLGIYLGIIWTRNLDEAAGAQSSKAVFITYMVGLMVCYWVFGLSNAVVADQSYVSEADLVGQNEFSESLLGAIRRKRQKRDEERARDNAQHSTIQSVSSHGMTSNMAVEPGVSTDVFEESAQTRVQQDSTTQSMSMQEELARVFQEAARLRKESAKVDERLAELIEKLGRGSEG